MISVILPVYNEEKTVSQVIGQIKSTMKTEDYEIIAVNDGSRDHTAQALSGITGIKVVSHPYNLGYGASLKTGIKESRGTHILIIDSDGTYPVDAIPALLRYHEDYDMVIGARTGKNVQIPFLRKPAKLTLGAIANILTGKRIPDLNSGMRIFRRELAERFFHLFPSKFSFTTTLTIAALTNDYTVKFIPINYFRRKGESTIRPNDFVSFTALILKLIIYFNPIKIFSIISILLFLISLAIALYGIIFHKTIMDITVIVILLASLQIFLFGIIAELIVKTKK